MSCTRSQEYLAKEGIQARETVDAKKKTLGREEALKLARSADQIHAARGKNVVSFDLLRQQPTDDELAAAILGPTGNLRAPAIRKGRALLIGFGDEVYTKLLK